MTERRELVEIARVEALRGDRDRVLQLSGGELREHAISWLWSAASW